jgi:small subunit ribosomal protein S6
MRKYELTVVLPDKATAAKKKSATEKIKKLVKTLKGKIGKVDEWGEIDLAYKIGKNDTGTFLHFPLELDPETVKSVNDKLRLEEEIIRYLLVRKDDPPSRKAAAR